MEFNVVCATFFLQVSHSCLVKKSNDFFLILGVLFFIDTYFETRYLVLLLPQALPHL